MRHPPSRWRSTGSRARRGLHARPCTRSSARARGSSTPSVASSQRARATSGWSTPSTSRTLAPAARRVQGGDRDVRGPPRDLPGAAVDGAARRGGRRRGGRPDGRRAGGGDEAPGGSTSGDQGVLREELRGRDAEHILMMLTSFESFDVLYAGRACRRAGDRAPGRDRRASAVRGAVTRRPPGFEKPRSLGWRAPGLASTTRAMTTYPRVLVRSEQSAGRIGGS